MGNQENQLNSKSFSYYKTDDRILCHFTFNDVETLILSSLYVFMNIKKKKDYPKSTFVLAADISTNGSDQFSSVAQSCPNLCDSMNCSTPGLPVHHQLIIYPNPCPLSRWCHPTISSSVVPFSSCPQSLPASESDTPVQKIVLTVKNLLTASQTKLSKWPISI